MEDFVLQEAIPTVTEYHQLRKAVGWYVLDKEATRAGLSNSLYCLCVRQQEQIVGCGRVVGDGGIYYYIQDIIVLPEFQRRGIGKRIMDSVMEFIRSHAADNAFIGLMAAEGVSGFYEKYGFAPRPAGRPGMFIVWKK